MNHGQRPTFRPRNRSRVAFNVVLSTVAHPTNNIFISSYLTLHSQFDSSVIDLPQSSYSIGKFACLKYVSKFSTDRQEKTRVHTMAYHFSRKSSLARDEIYFTTLTRFYIQHHLERVLRVKMVNLVHRNEVFPRKKNGEKLVDDAKSRRSVDDERSG